jgi:hypothetical protein
MALVLYLITDVLFGNGVASLTAGLGALLFAGLWFVLPLTRRIQSKNE